MIHTLQTPVSMHELLKDLDDDQKLAVTAPMEDMLCIAPAGSGKTRVLTYRTTYLIHSGVPEENIMLFTFTNKAAGEMVSRMQKLLKKTDIRIMAGTFHHVAGVFLRKYAHLLGFKPNFSILSTGDAQDLIFSCRQKYLAEHEEIKKDFPSKAILYHFYSNSINLNRSIPLVNVAEFNYPIPVEKAIEEILKDYQMKKKEHQCMDFDDMLVFFLKLLKDYPEVRRNISKQYRYLLVDEYQDINWIQNEIIELLNEDNHHLTAVGDESQTIYSFRGSKIDFIHKFAQNHPGARIYTIRHNYRSQQDIIQLAVHSINKNYHKEPKQMIAHIPCQGKPVIMRASNEKLQGHYIANQIQTHHKNGIPYKEMAILVRANFLTKTLELALQQNGIPYKMLAGTPFFERQHIRDILAFLKFHHNPADVTAFHRLARLFDGIGAKTAEKFYEVVKNKQFRLEDIEDNEIPFRLGTKAFGGIKAMMEVMDMMLKKDTISKRLNSVFVSFYSGYMKTKFEDFSHREKDIMALIESAYDYTDMDAFLADTILDKSENGKNEEEDDCVVITTVHKSKGLEWDCVFLPYLNEDIFPSQKSMIAGEVEEERRLFYVAVTRAKKHLFISYVLSSVLLRFGGSPSMFLNELQENLYQDVIIN